MPFRIRVSFLYRPDLSDPLLIRAFVRAMPIAAALGGWAFFALADDVGAPAALLLGLIVLCVGTVGVTGAFVALAEGSARAFASFLFPSGRSTPMPQDFSHEKSLAARGRVDEALAMVEARLFAAPDDAEVCIFAADLYAREAEEPRKAEELFRRSRAAKRVSAAQDLYATQRLIDLYLGPLDDEPRAADELRRLMEKHPTTRAAEHADHALRGLSAPAPAARLP